MDLLISLLRSFNHKYSCAQIDPKQHRQLLETTHAKLMTKQNRHRTISRLMWSIVKWNNLRKCPLVSYHVRLNGLHWFRYGIACLLLNASPPNSIGSDLSSCDWACTWWEWVLISWRDCVRATFIIRCCCCLQYPSTMSLLYLCRNHLASSSIWIDEWKT